MASKDVAEDFDGCIKYVHRGVKVGEKSYDVSTELVSCTDGDYPVVYETKISCKCYGRRKTVWSKKDTVSDEQGAIDVHHNTLAKLVSGKIKTE